MLSGDVLSGVGGDDLMTASSFALEFSLDIGSDIELSDPNFDGDEAADPGDVYMWQSLSIKPPGRDGFKDDATLFGADPYRLYIEKLDYGDAPESAVTVGRYPTTFASNGARHVIDDLYFGTVPTDVDADPNGQPNATATGDDADGNNDERGVIFNKPLLWGMPTSVDVTASAPGRVSVWIDLNGDQDWTDPGERVVADYLVAAGMTTIPFALPPTPAVVPTLATFARARVNVNAGLTSTGLAIGGEVEDRAVEVHSPGAIAGQKYWDVNANRKWDSGEPLLSGWTIFVDRNDSGKRDPGEEWDLIDSADTCWAAWNRGSTRLSRKPRRRCGRRPIRRLRGPTPYRSSAARLFPAGTSAIG